MTAYLAEFNSLVGSPQNQGRIISCLDEYPGLLDSLRLPDNWNLFVLICESEYGKIEDVHNRLSLLSPPAASATAASAEREDGMSATEKRVLLSGVTLGGAAGFFPPQSPRRAALDPDEPAGPANQP